MPLVPIEWLGSHVELPAGLVLPGPTGAPDGEPLSTRITLPGHTGLLALRP